MFLLDSLMIAGIQWALKTVVTAAEAEMNDDSALRDRLLEAEMQREMGEITDEEFAEIEADLLQAIREIKQRRDGGSSAFGFSGAQPLEAGENSHFQVEAELSGDYHTSDGHRAERPDPVVESETAIVPAVEPPPARRPPGRRTRTPKGPGRARTSRVK